MGAAQSSSRGVVLRRLRREAGLSQRALAEVAEVSVRTVRGIETGQISQPQPATLAQLVSAIRPRAPRAEQLMALWTRDSSVCSLDELMQPEVSVQDALTEAGVDVTLGCRLLHVAQVCHVDATRRQSWSDHEFVVEAEVEGLSSYLALRTSDPAGDLGAVQIDRTHGCSVRTRTPVESIGAMAFDLAFEQPAAVGQTRLFGFTIRRGSDAPLPHGLDWTFNGLRAPANLHILEVVFSSSVVPRTVWEIMGPSRTCIRELELAPSGSVHIAAEHRPAGSYGIAWRW